MTLRSRPLLKCLLRIHYIDSARSFGATHRPVEIVEPGPMPTQRAPEFVGAITFLPAVLSHKSATPFLPGFGPRRRRIRVRDTTHRTSERFHVRAKRLLNLFCAQAPLLLVLYAREWSLDGAMCVRSAHWIRSAARA